MTIKRSVGMFISPEGESLFVQTSHINAVINDPGLFGITHKEIQKTYQNHDEPLGLEGRARIKLLSKVLKNGWIRLRRYPNRQWSVTVDRYSSTNKQRLKDWAKEIMSGQLGQKEADAYMPVVITQLESPNIVVIPLIELSIQTLSEGGFYG